MIRGPRTPQDVLNARYDAAIRLRVEGLSYRRIAERLGLGSPDEARNAYMQGRAAQIPVDRSRPHPRPSETFIAWAAGFFDGEGWIGASERLQGDYREFRFAVGVAQTVRTPLDELQAAWGGVVRLEKPRLLSISPIWSWWVRGIEAAWFLEDVLPHLRVKCDPAQAVLPVMFRTHRKGVGFTEAELAERRLAIAIVAAAAKKGRRRSI